MVGVIVFLLAAAAVGGYLYERHRTGSIYHPHARFVPQPTPKLPARGPERFAWPLYGYTPDHLRYLRAPLEPPFNKLWFFPAHGLLEFPPVIADGTLYQLNDNAVLNALDTANGHLRWSRTLGQVSASTPAVGGGVVYATVLRRSGGHGGSNEEGKLRCVTS